MFQRFKQGWRDGGGPAEEGPLVLQALCEGGVGGLWLRCSDGRELRNFLTPGGDLGLDKLTSLQSIHKKMGPGSGELPYLAIFRDFIVHSAVLRTLKFEKGSKKGA